MSAPQLPSLPSKVERFHTTYQQRALSTLLQPGGDWIVKLPSARHLDVPDIDLLPVEAIDGLPDGIARYGASAYAIRRFDRTDAGPVHIKDFAQVFGF